VGQGKIMEGCSNGGFDGIGGIDQRASKGALSCSVRDGRWTRIGLIIIAVP
jgi:hypothetical protein